MTTRLLIGDVFERMAELPDGSFDFIVTSPPFLCLRSYLPDGHPDKAKEIGSEATPADYLDTLLALTAEWRRLLAPHGSIAIELGDKYAGSGGAGGDYDDGAWRDGQNRFGSVAGRNGWPLDKSLTGIPTLYAWSLAYGRNLLTGQPSLAGQWRIRNLKPWVRSNPPVGALGDKERPATSYITVACVGRDRWFDLDAVRTRSSQDPATLPGMPSGRPEAMAGNPGGAPPLDWWHPIDALIDDELNQRAGKPAGHAGNRPPRHRNSADGHDTEPHTEDGGMSIGARGTHIRRRLEQAGYLTPQDFHDVSPKGYVGAHYAVWPPELVRQLVDEMCPRRVCRECGMPSRRIVGEVSYVNGRTGQPATLKPERWRNGGEVRNKPGGESVNQSGASGHDQNATRVASTVGWSDCGHDAWRPGRICDPFVGSGTTLAVASGMGRDSIGIDLDERNADLCQERVGMFLEIDYPTREVPA